MSAFFWGGRIVWNVHVYLCFKTFFLRDGKWTKGQLQVLQWLAKVWAPFNGWFAGGKNSLVTKEGYEKCPSCKCKVQFLCTSSKLISQLAGAPSRNNVLRPALNGRIPSQARSLGDTNSEQDICIPAIYVKVVTFHLNLAIQTNKQTDKRSFSHDS